MEAIKLIEEAKCKCQNSILDAVVNFESFTGLKVSSIEYTNEEKYGIMCTRCVTLIIEL